MRYGIVIDSKRCLSCYNCYIACKDEHCGMATTLSAPKPESGQFWMDIREWERGDNARRMKTATVPTPCLHCESPACMAVAKDDAVYKRPDGIVIIDPVKAKGQKQIVDACPVGAAFWNEELQLPQKCTMCAELLDKGWEMPRCVQACPNEAMYFGDLDDPESTVSKLVANGNVTVIEGMEGHKTNVIHLNIPKIFLCGTVYMPKNEVAIGARVTLTDKASGESRFMYTNDFGDWEFEDLPKNRQYVVSIQMAGYLPVSLETVTDKDRYVADVYLEKV